MSGIKFGQLLIDEIKSIADFINDSEDIKIYLQTKFITVTKSEDSLIIEIIDKDYNKYKVYYNEYMITDIVDTINMYTMTAGDFYSIIKHILDYVWVQNERIREIKLKNVITDVRKFMNKYPNQICDNIELLKGIISESIVARWMDNMVTTEINFYNRVIDSYNSINAQKKDTDDIDDILDEIESYLSTRRSNINHIGDLIDHGDFQLKKYAQKLFKNSIKDLKEMK